MSTNQRYLLKVLKEFLWQDRFGALSVVTNVITMSWFLTPCSSESDVSWEQYHLHRLDLIVNKGRNQQSYPNMNHTCKIFSTFTFPIRPFLGPILCTPLDYRIGSHRDPYQPYIWIKFLGKGHPTCCRFFYLEDGKIVLFETSVNFCWNTRLHIPGNNILQGRRIYSKLENRYSREHWDCSILSSDNLNFGRNSPTFLRCLVPPFSGYL
jgi:hypothetical protein